MEYKDLTAELLEDFILTFDEKYYDKDRKIRIPIEDCNFEYLIDEGYIEILDDPKQENEYWIYTYKVTDLGNERLNFYYEDDK